MTPDPITNRPALGQVSYRAGRYATFRESMLTALSDPAFPPLAGLRTRDPADFSIALIDSWAVVLDILTFYSERLANEAFLRTAVEQRSVTELATLVGYTPSPGVAASATLAFTLATAPGSPGEVLIPAGTRVQSVPGPGQTPQVFETSADLTARPGWNALPAQATRPWSLSGNEQSTWITGTADNISVGDALLFVAAPGGEPSVTSGSVELHYVTAVSVDQVAKTTQLTWEAPLSTPSRGAAMYVFRKKAALFGANAPSPQTLSGPNISHMPGWPATAPDAEWHYESSYTAGSSEVSLDASYPGLTPTAGGPPQWLAIIDSRGTRTGAAIFQITAAQDTTPNLYTLTSRVTTLTVTNPKVIGGPWAWELGETPTLDNLLRFLIKKTLNVTAWVDSVPLTGAPLPLDRWGITLLRPGVPGMLEPVGGPAITVTGGQAITPGQPAGVFGKRVRLRVAAGTHASFTPAGGSGGSPVPDGQTFLLDSAAPTIVSARNIIWPVITTSGIPGSLTWPPDNPWPTLLPADKADPVVGEAVVIQAATPSGDETTLTLAAPLSRVYDRATVRVNANAVLATHGETTQEILGSGDAASPALTFTLRQAPLSYLTAAVPSGALSTLQVWVNDLRWREAPDLLAAGPADRVFTTSVDPAGHIVVRFGDGTHGGRPPTGQANIRAVYRKGTGNAGMVAAGQLSQALDRPQGLSSVINPGPATGAADPATADEVRASAPLPTLTIGRVVSLRDYQDHALGFAGIAKALATWMWLGSARGVFLTVAGADGAVLAPDDPVLTSLATSLRQYGDPHMPLRLAAYVPVLFTFTADVAVDTTTHDPSLMLAQAWQEVSAAFAFGNRALGQGVTASEIIGIVQGIPGVKAVRLRGPCRSGESLPTAPVMLPASGPRWLDSAGPLVSAELLVLDPATQGQLGRWSA